MAQPDDPPAEAQRPEGNGPEEADEGERTTPRTAKKKSVEKKVTKKRVAGKKAAAKKIAKKKVASSRQTSEGPSMAEDRPAVETASAEPTPMVRSAPSEPPGIGAAIAQWGPVVLVALLIVIFRAGGDAAAARAAASAARPATDLATPSGSALDSLGSGLGLPPLTLPGSDKLIEELTSGTWNLEGNLEGNLERGMAGSREGGAMPRFGSGAGAPRSRAMGPPPGGHPYPPRAGGFPGYGPMGQPYPGYPPQDPYWWSQGQAGSLPPPPPSGSSQ